MKLGNLIFYLFWGLVIIGILIVLFRKMFSPEEKSSSEIGIIPKNDNAKSNDEAKQDLTELGIEKDSNVESTSTNKSELLDANRVTAAVDATHEATPTDLPSALSQALTGNISGKTRQATEFALRYVGAVTYLDDCGDFTLEKLRESYDIAGLTAKGTREETQNQWDKSELILSTPGSPGGSEFIRHDMRRLLLEGITNAAPHIGLLEGPLREWLEQRRARSAAVPGASAEKDLSRGTPDAITLADANQFLRYRADSRAKVDAQVALMDALLTQPDVPAVQAALLLSVAPNDEFPWLIVKSGTHGAIAEMRTYAGFDETFKSLFVDQPFSIVWADHIAENCPGPGEAVTPLGREKYAHISQAIADGKYLLERHLGEARS